MPFKMKILSADTRKELEEQTNHFLQQCSFVPTIAPAKYGRRKWYTTVTYTFLEGDNKDTLSDKEKELYEMNNVLHLYRMTKNMEEIASALGLEAGEVNRYLMKAGSLRGNGEE